MSEKITVYRIRQAISGGDRPEIFYFRSKEELQHYKDRNDHFDSMRPIRVSPAEIKRNPFDDGIQFYYKQGTFEPVNQW